MTRGQIFVTVSDSIKGNEDYQKNFAEMSEYYGYLKQRLPKQLAGALDMMYTHLIGMETIAMEAAYMLGAGKPPINNEIF